MSAPVVHEGEALEAVLSRIAGELVETRGVGSWSVNGGAGRRASCVVVCRSAEGRVAAYAALTGAGLRFLGSKDLPADEADGETFWLWADGALPVEELVERLEAMAPAPRRPRSVGPAVQGVACPRCKSEAGAPCFSVGPDTYSRGAPLKRAHAERHRATRAADDVSVPRPLAERPDAAVLEAISERSAGSIPAGHGESHSLVVHELWVLADAGSNPASPTDAIARDVPLGDPVARVRVRRPRGSGRTERVSPSREATAGVSRRLLPMAGADGLPPQTPAPEGFRGARRARDVRAIGSEADFVSAGRLDRQRRAAAPRAALPGAPVAFRAVDRDARFYRERELGRRLRDTFDLDERARVRRYGAAMRHLDEVRDAIANGEPPDDVRLLYRIAGSFSLLELGERGSIVESRARKLGALFGEASS